MIVSLKNSDIALSDLKLGTIYLVSQEDGSACYQYFLNYLLPASLRSYFENHSALEGFVWKKLSKERLIVLPQAQIDEFLPPILDFEASLSAIAPDTSINEILGITRLIKEVFSADADLFCSLDQEKLVAHDFSAIAQAFLGSSEELDLIAIGYKITVSEGFLKVRKSTKKVKNIQDDSFISDALLWQFREARSIGFKRFIVDGVYIQTDDRQISHEIENVSLAEISDEERAVLKNAQELVILERIFAVSDLNQEILVSHLNECKLEGVLSGRQGASVLGLKKSINGYELKQSLSLSGNYLCPKCFSAFEIKALKLPHGVERKYAGYLEDELSKLNIMEILTVLCESSKAEQVNRCQNVLENSFLHDLGTRNLVKDFSHLSYFEQVIVYLVALALRQVSGIYYIMNFSQVPESIYQEGAPRLTPKVLEFFRALKFAASGGVGFVYFSNFDHQKLIEEIDNATVSEQVVGNGCLPNEKARAEDFISFVNKNEIVNVFGDIGSGKTTLLLNYALEHSGPKRKGASHKKEARHFFSFNNQSVQYHSNYPDPRFNKLSNLDSSILDLLGLKDYFVNTYSNLRQAKLKELYKSDFINTKDSIHRCHLCEGAGYQVNQLALGYLGQKICNVCFGSGLGNVFDEVIFFDYGYRTLLQKDLLEVLESFCGEPSVAFVFEFLKKAPIHFSNIKLGSRLFELTKIQKILFLILELCVVESEKNHNFKDRQMVNVYVLEHVFDQFMEDQRLLSVSLGCLEAYLNKNSSRIIISSYSMLPCFRGSIFTTN